MGKERPHDLIAGVLALGWKRVLRFAISLPQSCHWLPATDGQRWDDHFVKVDTRHGLHGVSRRLPTTVRSVALSGHSRAPSLSQARSVTAGAGVR